MKKMMIFPTPIPSVKNFGHIWTQVVGQVHTIFKLSTKGNIAVPVCRRVQLLDPTSHELQFQQTHTGIQYWKNIWLCLFTNSVDAKQLCLAKKKERNLIFNNATTDRNCVTRTTISGYQKIDGLNETEIYQYLKTVVSGKLFWREYRVKNTLQESENQNRWSLVALLQLSFLFIFFVVSPELFQVVSLCEQRTHWKGVVPKLFK